LKTTGIPRFVVDLRTADRNPAVAAMLEKPWPFRLGEGFEPIVPRAAADAIVYFDRVTPTLGH
jgi:hypothetical protein